MLMRMVPAVLSDLRALVLYTLIVVLFAKARRCVPFQRGRRPAVVHGALAAGYERT